MAKDAEDLAAFLSDWSEHSTFVPTATAAAQTASSSPPSPSHQRRQRSHSQPPPATPNLPIGGKLLRRRKRHTVEAADNDGGDTHQGEAIDSAMRALQISSSHSLQEHNLGNQNDISHVGHSSPSCILTSMSERTDSDPGARDSVSGILSLPLPPLPFFDTRRSDVQRQGLSSSTTTTPGRRSIIGSDYNEHDNWDEAKSEISDPGYSEEQSDTQNNT